MKYARYNVNKKKRNITLVPILGVIIILAFVVGTGLFKLSANFSPALINSGNSNEPSIESEVSQSTNETETETINSNINNKFYIIQGGVFTTNESANSVKNSLGTYDSSYIVDDNGKFKVLLGFYNEDSFNTKAKELSDKGVENSKITISLPKDDKCDATICEVVEAYVTVINKLKEQDVDTVKSEEFKKWLGDLNVDSNSSNSKLFEDLKSYGLNLPDDLSKSNIDDLYKFLYGSVINYRMS